MSAIHRKTDIMACCSAATMERPITQAQIVRRCLVEREGGEDGEAEGQRVQGGMNVEDEGAGYVNKLLELVEQSRGKVPPAWEGIKGCCHEITGNQQK